MANRGRATVVMVAERAGVSIASVSRVLNGLSTSDDVRANVLRAAAELDYVPDAVARSLKVGRTDQVALAVADVGNPVYVSMIHAIADVLGGAGLRLVISSDGADPEDQLGLLGNLSRGYCDGLILSPLRVTTELLDALGTIRQPIVVIGSLPPHLDIDNVRADSAAGVGLALDHLAATGRRHIAFVNGPIDTVPGAARLRGFVEHSARLGLPTSADMQVESADFTYAAAVPARRGAAVPGDAGRDRLCQRPPRRRRDQRAAPSSNHRPRRCRRRRDGRHRHRRARQPDVDERRPRRRPPCGDRRQAAPRPPWGHRRRASPPVASLSSRRSRSENRRELRSPATQAAGGRSSAGASSLASERGPHMTTTLITPTPGPATSPRRSKRASQGPVGGRGGGDAWKLVLPCLLPVMLFSVYPLLRGIYLGFTDAEAGLNATTTFTGLENYRNLRGYDLFWDSFRIGLIWTFSVTTCSSSCRSALALLLNLDLELRWLARTLALVPWAIPPVIVAIMWRLMLHPRSGRGEQGAPRAGVRRRHQLARRLQVRAPGGDPRRRVVGHAADDDHAAGRAAIGARGAQRGRRHRRSRRRCGGSSTSRSPPCARSSSPSPRST